MLQIQLGHRYRDRQGVCSVITRRITKQTSEYFNGFRYSDDRARSYKPDGRWGIDGAEHPHDLIEDLGIKVEVRKVYWTEKRKQEKIIAVVPEDHPFHKDGFRFRSESGRYYRSDGSRCRDRLDDLGNIVEEFHR